MCLACAWAETFEAAGDTVGRGEKGVSHLKVLSVHALDRRCYADRRLEGLATASGRVAVSGNLPTTEVVRHPTMAPSQSLGLKIDLVGFGFIADKGAAIPAVADLQTPGLG